MLYSFYVGSTDAHHAHTVQGNPVPDAFPLHLGNVERALVYGVWGGVTEATAIYSAELASDDVAQRIAYAMTVLTGNACVLVVRDTNDRDDVHSLNSTRRFRVSSRTVLTGDRTLYTESGQTVKGADDWPGYRYESDPTGAEIAYLVHLDATVTPVQG